MEKDKLKPPSDVDKYIPVEIPDKDLDLELYKLVGSCMMHGPCGEYNKNALCNINENCSEFFQRNLFPT